MSHRSSHVASHLVDVEDDDDELPTGTNDATTSDTDTSHSNTGGSMHAFHQQQQHSYRQASEEDMQQVAGGEEEDAPEEDEEDAAQQHAAYYASALRQQQQQQQQQGNQAFTYRTPQPAARNSYQTPTRTGGSGNGSSSMAIDGALSSAASARHNTLTSSSPAFATPTTSLTLSTADDDDGLGDMAQSGLATVPSTPPLGPVTAPAPKKLLASGLAAMKRNLIPGLCLQALALTIIIIYYSSESAKASFNKLADFKSAAGYLFSGISTAICGGTIPWTIAFMKKEYERRKKAKALALTADLDLQSGDAASTTAGHTAGMPLGTGVSAQSVLLTGSEIPLENFSSLQDLEAASPSHTAAADVADLQRDAIVWTNGTPRKILASAADSLIDPGKPAPWAECLYLTGFWFLKGMEVDAFYRLQGVIFGDGADFVTIFAKVCCDQFIYNPIWGTPSVLGGYLLKDSNFNLRVFWSRLATKHFFFWKVPECLLSVWIVWCPACTMIYILPSALQVPLFNIVLCFWALVLAMLTGE